MTDVQTGIDVLLRDAWELARHGDHAIKIQILLSTARRLIDAAQELSHDLDIGLGSATATNAQSGAKKAVTESVNPVVQRQNARRIYRIRRLRDEIFGDCGLFGEPAWDILLDLLAAERERKSITVSSACIGSAVPSTTALRWIGVLESQCLIERAADPLDHRRSYVMLTSKARHLMNAFFVQVARRDLL